MKYIIALQILSIVTIIVLLYIIFRIIIANKKKRRIDPFSLHLNHRDDSLEKEAITFINRVSKFLTKLVIFNNIAKTYDKYIYEDSKRFKTGMDYISLKIVLGIIFIIAYLLNSYLYRIEPKTILIISTFIMGFLIPDFYCILKQNRNRKRVNDNILSAIIILNNSLKNNKKIETSIEDIINTLDGPIKKEFQTVLFDIRIGLNYQEAFQRMYKRTKIKEINTISRIFKIENNTNQIIKLLNELESRMTTQEHTRFKISRINTFNKIINFICYLIPLITIILLNINNKKALINKYGALVITIEIFIYIDYLLVIRLILGGSKNE